MTPSEALELFLARAELAELSLSVDPESGAFTLALRRTDQGEPPAPPMNLEAMAGDSGVGGVEAPKFESVFDDPMTFAHSGTMPDFGGEAG